MQKHRTSPTNETFTSSKLMQLNSTHTWDGFLVGRFIIYLGQKRYAITWLDHKATVLSIYEKWKKKSKHIANFWGSWNDFTVETKFNDPADYGTFFLVYKIFFSFKFTFCSFFRELKEFLRKTKARVELLSKLLRRSQNGLMTGKILSPLIGRTY